MEVVPYSSVPAVPLEVARKVFHLGEVAVAVVLPVEPFLAKVLVKAFLVEVAVVQAKPFLAEV